VLSARRPRASRQPGELRIRSSRATVPLRLGRRPDRRYGTGRDRPVPAAVRAPSVQDPAARRRPGFGGNRSSAGGCDRPLCPPVRTAIPVEGAATAGSGPRPPAAEATRVETPVRAALRNPLPGGPVGRLTRRYRDLPKVASDQQGPGDISTDHCNGFLEHFRWSTEAPLQALIPRRSTRPINPSFSRMIAAVSARLSSAFLRNRSFQFQRLSAFPIPRRSRLVNQRRHHVDAPCRSVPHHAAGKSNTSTMASGLARPSALPRDAGILPRTPLRMPSGSAGVPADLSLWLPLGDRRRPIGDEGLIVSARWFPERHPRKP
jgi:hypothetical protein